VCESKAISQFLPGVSGRNADEIQRVDLQRPRKTIKVRSSDLFLLKTKSGRATKSRPTAQKKGIDPA
jgi:hypothetical protein